MMHTVHVGTPTAVICDDDQMLRSLIARMVAEVGYELIAEVSVGTELVEVSRITKPDVIILDVSLPGDNGLFLISELKADSPGTRVVVFSAFDRPLDRGDWTMPDAWVAKASPTDLEDTLRAWLPVA